MCGICGIIDFRPASDIEHSRARVDAMLEVLRHRGPNAIGALGTGSAMLGATRLAVRGLDAANQPVVDAATGVIVVCNGEIDNHQELRQWLEARGRRVPPGSDVEVLPGLYLEIGEDFVNRLAGAFAIAVWDPRSAMLHLARDRAGERPLFFAVTADGVVFASEISALLASGAVPVTVSANALRGYLQFGNFAAPLSPFNEVQKVAPGERIAITASGAQRRIYWRWDIASCPKRAPSVDDFDQIFREAVRRQSEVDVDFAVFLSGGVDSSLVAAVARSLRPDRRLRGYTVRFHEDSFDEGDSAHTVANLLGMEHHSVWVKPEDVRSELPALVRRVGEPLADPAWLPAALLSREAGRDFRMTLVGEGADELFGGYPTYIGAAAAEHFARLPPLVAGAIRRLIQALPPSDKKVTASYLLKRFVAGADADGMERHQLWNSNIPPELLRRLGIEPAPFLHEQPEGRDLLDRIQQWDLEVPLAEGLLTKADRASMSSALELRAPFLDQTVIQFAATLPPEERVHGLTTKVFLKRYALRYLPRSIVHRRKRGLSVPIGSWLRGPLHDWAAATLANPRLDDLGIRRSAVADLLAEHCAQRADHGRALWTLVVLSHWLDWTGEIARTGLGTPGPKAVPETGQRSAMGWN